MSVAALAQTKIEESTCCVVGGGPAGMVLAYLLARDGIQVTVIESQANFDREFRGDTFHAASLELVEALGLMPKFEALIRAKLKELSFTTSHQQRLPMVNFSRLSSRYPFVAIVAQADFLDLLVAEATRWPNFNLRLQAHVHQLLEKDGRVCGVRYQQDGRTVELHANLVIGADGRGSKLRALAGFELDTMAPPMDVIWGRLPRQSAANADGFEIFIEDGKMMILLSRGDSWQFGYVVMKGAVRHLLHEGIGALHQAMAPMLPAELGAQLHALTSWDQVSILNVQVGRVRTWHKPGLLLIGDAAHVMSPIGGVGVNYAIQDAVAAYHVLAPALEAGVPTDAQLAAVQRRREWPTQVMQRIQTVIQRQIIRAALESSGAFRLPLAVRLLAKIPVLRNIPAWLFAYGVQHERLSKTRRKTARPAH